MPSTKTLKNRIKSAASTSQITKAMEAVSAAKMRHSQDMALAGRPFVAASINLLKDLKNHTKPEFLPSYFNSYKNPKRLLIAVTSDKGLAGALNHKVLDDVKKIIYNKPNFFSCFAAVGRKAKDFFERENITLQDYALNFGDYTELEETLPFAKKILSNFPDGFQELWVAYTSFVSTLSQKNVVRKIMPIELETLEGILKEITPAFEKYPQTGYQNSSDYYQYLYEPSAAEVLHKLSELVLYTTIHHIILESNASEHSSRMIAMKNASENAAELITLLTRQFNKIRQGKITAEIIEITSVTES